LLGAKSMKESTSTIAVDARRGARAHWHPCVPGGAPGANVSTTFKDNGANEN